MTAAKKGNAIEVQRLIDIPEVDVNYADRSRMDARRVLGNHTSLYLAARYGHEEVVKVLLQHPKLDVNHRDYFNRTALWLAINRGHLPVSKLLINDNRTDVNMAGGAITRSSRNKPMVTPLYMASRRYKDYNQNDIPHYLEVVKLLVSHPQIDINKGSLQSGETPLLVASMNGNEEVVKELLAHPKIDVNKVYESGPDEGASALLVASSNRPPSLEVVKDLLSHPDIDVNHQVDSQYPKPTALFIASQKGNLTLLKMLLAHEKIDVNQGMKGNRERTALFTASAMGNVDIVKALLDDQRVDVNQPDDRGATPLFIISTKPSYIETYDDALEVMKLLLADPRVDPNILSTSGSEPSAITAAAMSGNLEAVRLLLRCPKVTLGLKDMYGRSEIDYAREKSPRVPDELRLQILEAIESRQALLEQGHTC